MASRRLVTAPAFQFYPQDWLVGTSGLTLAAKGVYAQILAFGWLNGSVPANLNNLAKLICCTREELDAVWPEVLPKLRETKRGLVNPRQEKQRGELRRYREKNKRAAITRWERERAAKQPQAEETTPAPHDAAPPQALAPINGNPHHAATNLINGADMRRHGSHAWCAFETSGERRDGLCIPQFLHAEFIGKSKRPEADVKAWYGSVLDRYGTTAIGEDALAFWRNEFAQWVGVVTSKPSDSKGARIEKRARHALAIMAQARPQ